MTEYPTTGGHTPLAPMRRRLDELDRQIVELIAARLAVCAEVAAVKRREGIPMMQPDRVRLVRERYAELGARHGADPDFMRALATAIIDEACRLEDLIIDGEPTGSATC